MTAANADWNRLEDPDLFLRLTDLRLVAQSVVEGALQGWHRSPLRGFGAEFDSHREYQPGDDPRHLNWNLFASHGRLYTKIFRAETNLDLHLLLDASGSMGTGLGPASKYRYACRAVAALACLARHTRDAAGLFVLREDIRTALPPSTRPGQLDSILALLENSQPGGAADIGGALSHAVGECRRRGIVAVFSDFFDKEDALLRGLRALRARGHEVLAFQILDPWECELPAEGEFEFADLETDTRLKTSAPRIRDRYAEAVTRWRGELGRACRAADIHWTSVTTRHPLILLVEDFLTRGFDRSA